MKSFFLLIQELILTVFLSGNLTKAPGTWGSIVSWILWMMLIFVAGWSTKTLTIFLAVVILVAIILITLYERRTKKHDEGRIVIDEFVGVGVTLLIIITATLNPIFLVLGLIFFRLFDIWKPSIIGYVDRNTDGALGVMLDDILAGICAGWVMLAIYFLSLRLGAI